MAEEGEDVAHASFEHAAEGGEFPAAFVAPRSGQVVDQLAHHAFAASPVVAPVGVYDPLVGVVGEHEVMVGLDGEQGHESGTAACAEVFVAGQQGAPAVVEPVALDTAPAGGVALQAAAHLGDAGGGQLHDVERVDDLDRVGHDGFDGLLPAGERVHGDHPDASCELAAARLHPFAKHLGGTARHHVQQSCRPAVATRGQVDDHGHVPVSERAVAPHVLVHADRAHRGEPVGLLEQQHALLAHRPVDHRPCHMKQPGARRDSHRVQAHAPQRPHHRRHAQHAPAGAHRLKIIAPRA